MKGDTSSMKSLLVVPSTATNLVILNENYNNNKENFDNLNTIETGLYNDSSNHNDNTNFINTTNKIESMTVSTTTTNDKNNDFQKLKRSHAIQDIQAMDDTSPVTYEDCILEEDKFVVQGIKIRAAKIPKLIHILIESFDKNGKILPDTDFPRVFILMHKWFMESEDLANMLVELYKKFEKEASNLLNENLSRANAINSQLKICHAIQYWINTFPFHFALDGSLKEVIRVFSSLIQEKGHQEHLQFVDMSNIDSYDWMRKFTTRNPIKSKQHIPLAFSKIEPDVLAGQLTYLEWKTLRRISFSDYKAYAIKGVIKDIPTLERSIQLFNGLSQWIQGMVLSKTTPKLRADVIHKFIEVAKHLRQLQNFNSLMAVIGGLGHSALARLSKTKAYLSAEDEKVFNDFNELLSASYNYAQYRKLISEINTFCIPIIGIHLKDLVSLQTAHLDKLENDLINFRKMAQLSVIFQNLTDLQNSLPPVQENRDQIKLLQLSLDMSYSEDEIYELSLAREPRTSVSSPSTPTKFSAFADWAKSVSTPPDPQTIQKHVYSMVDAVFKNYDHDRDGFISHAEFEEIAQNFPFVDAFAVLDADQDGMISKNEMKSYFLKANYHALKSEFKHDFHEMTYLKPTFCTHCDGFLWGLIKQGWKCKDCGINAHRHCKDRIVMECRSKRTIGITRQISNSGTETAAAAAATRKRSSFHKRNSVHKQASTQTEPYEDLFISDESASSNEDNCTRINTLINTNTKPDDTNYGSFESNSLTANKISESFDQCTNGSSSISSQRNNRQRRYKKFSKRRKSLPSQGSSNEEPHPLTLIPRGPLICSNNENNWLPDRFNGTLNYSLNINNFMNCDFDTSSNMSINTNNTNTNSNNMNVSSSTLSTTAASTTTNNNIKMKSNNNSNSNLSTTTSASLISESILKPSSLSLDTGTSSITKIVTRPKNKNLTFRNQIPSTVNYDINIIKTTIYNTSNSHTLTKTAEVSAAKCTNNNRRYRSRIESDYYLNDYIDDYQLDDEVIDVGTYSSNDDEGNDIIMKLKEAEKEREKLAHENARIKQQLESANAQIDSLKNEMSSIRNNAYNLYILDRINNLHFSNKTSEV